MFRTQLIIGLCIVSAFSLSSALKCYQCVTSDSKACNDSYLLDCPTDQAYDECSINFKKTAGNLIVVRKCVLGPCSLKSRDIPLSEKCDMSSSDFLDCIHCCREDGCNKDSVAAIQPNKWLLYAFLLITVIYSSLSSIRLPS